MLTKQDIMTELVNMGCSIAPHKLKKMTKRDLENILRNYNGSTTKVSKRPPSIDYEPSSSSDEDEEVEMNTLINNIQTQLQKQPAPPPAVQQQQPVVQPPVVQRPEPTQPPPPVVPTVPVEQPKQEAVESQLEEEPEKALTDRELRGEVKVMIKRFTGVVNEMIREYKEDGDKEYLVDRYNELCGEVEMDVSNFLSDHQAKDGVFNYADSLLQTQNKRIARMVG